MSESQRQVGGGPKGNKNALVHGMYAYKAMLDGKGLDRRSSLHHALMEKEQELVTALGGDPSPQERIIIADTVKHLLFAASLDRYLLSLKSLVRKSRVHGVVSERTRIGVHIRENLRAIGLTRKTKALSLDDILNQDETEPDSAATPHGETNGEESKP